MIGSSNMPIIRDKPGALADYFLCTVSMARSIATRREDSIGIQNKLNINFVETLCTALYRRLCRAPDWWNARLISWWHIPIGLLKKSELTWGLKLRIEILVPGGMEFKLEKFSLKFVPICNLLNWILDIVTFSVTTQSLHAVRRLIRRTPVTRF